MQTPPSKQIIFLDSAKNVYQATGEQYQKYRQSKNWE
jgi:hypothetical protein